MPYSFLETCSRNSRVSRLATTARLRFMWISSSEIAAGVTPEILDAKPSVSEDGPWCLARISIVPTSLPTEPRRYFAGFHSDHEPIWLNEEWRAQSWPTKEAAREFAEQEGFGFNTMVILKQLMPSDPPPVPAPSRRQQSPGWPGRLYPRQKG